MNRFRHVKLLNHLFIIFFIGLIIAIYRGISEEYILLCFLISMLIKGKMNTDLRMKNQSKYIIIFIMYYLFSTILGVLMKYTEFSYIFRYTILMVVLPLTVSNMMTLKANSLVTSLQDMRNFIIIAAMFGLFESIVMNNFLYRFMVIDARSWIISMNSTIRTYQPSSFFLHYTYYASILITGIVLALVFPFKRKFVQRAVLLLLIEQVFAAQSRICWIAFVAIVIMYPFIFGKIEHMKVSRKFIRVLAFIAVCLLILVLIQPSFFQKLMASISDRFSSLFVYGMQEGSLGQRIGTLLNWPRYFSRNVLEGIVGTGYGSTEINFLASYSYFAGYSTADCQYLNLLVDTGIIGLGLFVVGIVYFTQKVRLIPLNFKRLYYIILIVYSIFCVTYNITTYFVIIPLFMSFVSANYWIKNRAKKHLLCQRI